jgi:hypothetical protein
VVNPLHVVHADNVEPCAQMNFGALLAKLIEIEHALGLLDNVTVRNLVIEAQDCALQIQKDVAEDQLRLKRGPARAHQSSSSA